MQRLLNALELRDSISALLLSLHELLLELCVSLSQGGCLVGTSARHTGAPPSRFGGVQYPSVNGSLTGAKMTLRSSSPAGVQSPP